MRSSDRRVGYFLSAFLVLTVLCCYPTKIKQPSQHVECVNCIVTPRSGQQITYRDAGEFTVTAYAATYEDCGKTDGITHSGAKATEGVTIAADWRVLPCGTRIYIDDIGWRTVQDTGGAVRGNRIDIYFDSEQGAREFGRQTHEIYILTEEKS